MKAVTDMQFNRRETIKNCPKCVITLENKVIVYPHLVLSLKTIFLMSICIKLFGILAIILVGAGLTGIPEEFKIIGYLLGAAIYLFGIQISALYRNAERDIKEIKQKGELKKYSDMEAKGERKEPKDVIAFERVTDKGKVLWKVENGYIFIGRRKYGIVMLKTVSLALSFFCATAMVISVTAFMMTQQSVALISSLFLAMIFILALYYKRIADYSNAIIMIDYQRQMDQIRNVRIKSPT